MARLIHWTFLAVLVLLFVTTNGQQQPQKGVIHIPSTLEECYRDPNLLYRFNRLPSQMATLIDLIRKVENDQSYTQDIRTLAVGLIQRFRLDGIVRARNVVTTSSVIPYGPRGFQYPKYKLLVNNLLQGNAYNLPNGTLTAQERCSLHFMLSSTLDMQTRGDESTVCSQLSQYKAMRVPRSIRKESPSDNKYSGDVELLETVQGGKQQSGPLQFGGEFVYGETDTSVEVGVLTPSDGYYPNNGGIGGIGGIGGNDQSSQCPLEGGVVWTPWGTVSAGSLIAGIAAGLQPQTVQVANLLKILAKDHKVSRQVNARLSVSSVYAATLAGDLAEVALLQGPSAQTTGQETVGASGGWNSTVLPRYFFLSQNQRLQMTDAEIRGSLDGLIIASNVANWRNQYNSLKLSQLLEMYYSQLGVLNSGIRSCDRKNFFTQVAPLQTLISQTVAFTTLLNDQMQLPVTIYDPAITTFATNAANALATYIPQYMNDLTCEATSLVPNQQVVWNTAADVYIFIDTTWMFYDINPVIAYFLQNININPFASRVTIMNAMDGSIIVNTTSYISDVYQYWNLTTHQMQPMGTNMPNILMKLSNITYNLAYEALYNGSVVSRSLVSLVVTPNGGVNQADSYFTSQRLQMLRETSPDLRLMFITSGSASSFSNYVQSSSKDLFTVNQGGNVVAQTIPLILRVRDMSRRIINYRCGPNWQPQNYGSAQMYQYVQPGSINFYRLLPNYYWGGNSNRRITIQGSGSASLTVCSSRYIEHPTGNTTQWSQSNNNQWGQNNNNQYNQNQNSLNCTQIGSDTYTVYLSDLCSGYSRIMDCPPYYFSVQASVQNSGQSSTSCTDYGCQYPNQVKYSIFVDNLSCGNSATSIVLSFALILATLFRYVFV